MLETHNVFGHFLAVANSMANTRNIFDYVIRTYELLKKNKVNYDTMGDHKHAHNNFFPKFLGVQRMSSHRAKTLCSPNKRTGAFSICDPARCTWFHSVAQTVRVHQLIETK
jgi:hypothetical protein